VGVAFRLNDRENYLSFEVMKKGCRLRKVVAGKYTQIV
jgi:hypothetical protein